jgi:hypothetical protein
VKVRSMRRRLEDRILALCAKALVIPDLPELVDIFEELKKALIEYTDRHALARVDLPKRRYND